MIKGLDLVVIVKTLIMGIAVGLTLSAMDSLYQGGLRKELRVECYVGQLRTTDGLYLVGPSGDILKCK